jgi:hypothetical protein
MYELFKYIIMFVIVNTIVQIGIFTQTVGVQSNIHVCARWRIKVQND